LCTAPIIYTPTVGKACIEFGSQFRRGTSFIPPQALSLSLFDERGGSVFIVIDAHTTPFCTLAPLTARGMYFSSADVGQMSAMIYNWPEKHVRERCLSDLTACSIENCGSFLLVTTLPNRWTSSS
jgi:hypothetical protein